MSAMNASRTRPRPGSRSPTRSASTRVSRSRPDARRGGAVARPVQHGRVEVDGGDAWPAAASGTAIRPVPAASSRIGPSAGRPGRGTGRGRPDRRAGRGRTAAQRRRRGLAIEHRSSARGQAGARVARRPSARRRPARPGAPSRRLTARALIASSAQRFAAIAVVSAWSYGGETSTMSIPRELDRADDLADRRAAPRGSACRPARACRCPGAMPGSMTSMSIDR